MLLRKFIRNEAIDKDPPDIYNLRTILVSLVVRKPLKDCE
jgi:hypothetical protein